MTTTLSPVLSASMVYKLAGWLITFEQAHAWLEAYGKFEGVLEEVPAGQERDFDMDNVEITCALGDYIAKGRKRKAFRIVVVDYPPFSKQAVVLLSRWGGQDPRSTPWCCWIVHEKKKDLPVREWIARKSGIPEEQLEWVTVSDPWRVES